MENNKKKIGIVTFHSADNYGAVLQAYALQTYLAKSKRNDVYVVDFCTPEHRKEYRIIKKWSKNPVKSIILNVLRIARVSSLIRRHKRFESFRENALKLTKHRYESEEEFLQRMEPFDFCIAGSDQVFNPKVRYSRCYYLAFDKFDGKKVAYAPSFGIVKFTAKEKDYIANATGSFTALCCREREGAEFLAALTGRNVPVVCDPVYLLDKEEWKEVAALPGLNTPYVFVYDLCGGSNLIELAKKVSSCNENIPIVCATGNIKHRYSGVTSLFDVGPRELLGYIANADFVVTDSFHGTSLSLVLNTKVITYIALKHVASRIYSIMNILGITDQIVEDINGFDMDRIRFVDYAQPMKTFVSSSKDYITKALEM